jgi:uncharacterized protein (TIGR02453 family)
MLQDYIHFSQELSQNNNKVWFDANRDRWENIRKEFLILVQEIIHEIAKFDHSMQFLQPKECVYRINRDVRFSNDKKPYKDYITAVFCPEGKRDGCVAYYFEIQPNGNINIGGGWYQIDSKKLLRLRNHIVENNEDVAEFRKILNDKEFQKLYTGLSEWSILKTHPKGFSKDSPSIDLLRHNNFVAIKNQKLVFGDDLEFVKILGKNFKVIAPFVNFLRVWEKKI